MHTDKYIRTCINGGCGGTADLSSIQVQQMRQHLAQRDAQIALPAPYPLLLLLASHFRFLTKGEADPAEAAS